MAGKWRNLFSQSSSPAARVRDCGRFLPKSGQSTCSKSSVRGRCSNRPWHGWATLSGSCRPLLWVRHHSLRKSVELAPGARLILEPCARGSAAAIALAALATDPECRPADLAERPPHHRSRPLVRGDRQGIAGSGGRATDHVRDQAQSCGNRLRLHRGRQSDCRWSFRGTLLHRKAGQGLSRRADRVGDGVLEFRNVHVQGRSLAAGAFASRAGYS